MLLFIMLYTLVSVVLHLSMPEQTLKINKTFTFKTQALCEKALDDKFEFIKKEKKYKKKLIEFITDQKDNNRVLKITFIDADIVNYSKCIKSEIAFNKEIFKYNMN